jgi:3',5'-cyclic-nucleotide phosphodiesterase
MQRPLPGQPQKPYKVSPIPMLIGHRTPIRPLQGGSREESRNSAAPTTKGNIPDYVIVPITKQSDINEDIASWDVWFDDFMSKCEEFSLCLALEQSMQQMFAAERAVYWANIPSLDQLYSETHGIATGYTTGLVAQAFFTKMPTRVTSPWAHPAFNAAVDGRHISENSIVFMFTLTSRAGDPVGVVQIVRDADITEAQSRFVEWFAQRYQLMHRWIDVPRDIDMLFADLQTCETEDEFRRTVFPRVRDDFNARDIEVWRFDPGNNSAVRFTTSARDTVKKEDGGIAMRSMTQMLVVNSDNSKADSSYCKASDGDQDDAVLCVPVTIDTIVWAVVLRRTKRLIFLLHDEIRMKKLVPIFARALLNCGRVDDPETDVAALRSEVGSLRALIDVLEMTSSQLDPDKLIHAIMEKGRTLINADRCSLFLVNETRDRLTTYLHTGLKSGIDIPIESGIAGRAVTKREVINITNAYKSPYFDSSTDQASGYRTQSVVSVPIFNTHGDVVGCTEMINKLSDDRFSDWDIKMIQLFNVFCGISLENAKLYRDSIDVREHMRNLLDTAFSLSKSEEIHKMLTDILQNAKKVVGADRASFFVVEKGKNELIPLIADGTSQMPSSIPIDRGLAGLAIQNREPIIENDCYMNPSFNVLIDRETGYHTKSLIAIPVFDNTGEILAVAELLNKVEGQFGPGHVDVFSAFAAFASIALQNSRILEVQQVGGVDAEMAKWITLAERPQFAVPAALQLTEDEKAIVMSMDCFAPNFKGIGHFKELFFFFTTFDFLARFQISAERFFRFLSEISSRYTDTSYHNWTHACDVSQCIFFMLYVGKLGEQYDAWELFSLLVASVCHDTAHRGFNNVFNVKAETPLGILYKDQSVMEMHHITQSIPVISRDDIQLFAHFSPSDVKKVWTLFIKIILSTDMARHFELVKGAQGALHEGYFDMSNPDYRLLGLQLLMKLADISNVSRPFEIADRWCDILNEEFFRQGDLEKASGIGLTSPLNDREKSNKPKSQIGFYNFICMPLYSVVANLWAPLQVNLDRVRANLERWKALLAAQPPPS